MSILTTADRFRYELEGLLKEKIEHNVGVVASGGSPDYAAYLRIVGRIEGLKAAMDCIEDAVHQLNYQEGKADR